jgi:hypothetical protein
VSWQRGGLRNWFSFIEVIRDVVALPTCLG